MKSSTPALSFVPVPGPLERTLAEELKDESRDGERLCLYLRLLGVLAPNHLHRGTHEAVAVDAGFSTKTLVGVVAATEKVLMPDSLNFGIEMPLQQSQITKEAETMRGNVSPPRIIVRG
jgi:hypothetical protein